MRADTCTFRSPLGQLLPGLARPLARRRLCQHQSTSGLQAQLAVAFVTCGHEAALSTTTRAHRPRTAAASCHGRQPRACQLRHGSSQGPGAHSGHCVPRSPVHRCRRTGARQLPGRPAGTHARLTVRSSAATAGGERAGPGGLRLCGAYTGAGAGRVVLAARPGGSAAARLPAAALVHTQAGLAVQALYICSASLRRWRSHVLTWQAAPALAGAARHPPGRMGGLFPPRRRAS